MKEGKEGSRRRWREGSNGGRTEGEEVKSAEAGQTRKDKRKVSRMKTGKKSSEERKGGRKGRK